VSITTLDLNLLVVLDSVLSERSVARAARRLHVTPSAVSNALARLRVELGDPLIARSGRGIVPTPRAAELGPALARALRDLDQAVHREAYDPLTTTRRLTLAVADAGQLVRLPPIAERMALEMPLARLRVVGIDSLVSLGGLAGTEVDVALGAGEHGTGVRSEALFVERIALIARRAHPITKQRVSKAVLASLRHVAIEMAPGKGFRDLAAVAFAKAGVPREVVMTVPSFTAAAAIVAGTDLVACVPASLLEVLGPRLGLRVVSGPVPAYTVTMSLSWHERTHADPALMSFRELVRRSLRG
jgi:DNA-binding transcriptional LysR family regulator